jgi:uncharacterized protein
LGVAFGARVSLLVRWVVLLCLVGVSATTSAATPLPQRGTDWRTSVRDFAAQHFKHPAWGFSHSVRNYELAKKLAAQDRVRIDDDVLFAAAMLHDMAAFSPWEKDDVDHADEAARIVDEVLRDTGFPMSKVDAVRGAIRMHMFDRTPKGPEALYLHDADALDWLGAIGVARVLSLIDPNGGSPDGARAVKMLERNLAEVPPRVLSPAGKRRVPALRAELSGFLKALRRETSNLRNL